MPLRSPCRALPALLFVVLVAAGCAASGGATTADQRNPRLYVADFAAMQTASADVLRRLRMDIEQAEALSDGSYLLVGRQMNANARGGGGGDSQMVRLEVTLEPVGGAQTRVRVTPSQSGSYGGTQARRVVEDFFDLLEAQGYTPLGD